MNKNLLVEYLNCRRLPITKYEGATQLHSTICEIAPAFYLCLLLDTVTDISHKREILLNFLSHGVARKFARHHILTQLYALPWYEALSIVEVVRERRINRSRARDLVRAFLLGHEQFPVLAATKKQRVIRLLRHSLGERTWSSARYFLRERSVDGETFLQRELLRYAWNGDVARAREALNFLTDVEFSPREAVLAQSLAARKDLEQGEGLPKDLLLGLRSVYSRHVPVNKVRYLSATNPTSVRTDGPLTIFYKEAFFEQERSGTPVATSAPVVSEPEWGEGSHAVVYEAFPHLFESEGAEPASLSGHQSQGGNAQAHEVFAAKQALPDHLAKPIASVPLIQGHLGIVLDFSASTISSGERRYHPVALALALMRLLQERVLDGSLHYVGGSTSFNKIGLPLPEGETDIATALLAAVYHKPDAILIISDGYENVCKGDTACVVQGLRQLGLTMPIYQVVPVFTLADNLAQRRLGDNIPLIPLAHEEGVRELLAYVVLAAADENLSVEEIKQLQQILSMR